MKLKAQVQELDSIPEDVDSLREQLQIQIEMRKATEAKLNKIQRLHNTMAHNFPDGIIGVLDRDMRYVLIEGKDLSKNGTDAWGIAGQKAFANQEPATAEEILSKLRKAFDGENVYFEIKIEDRFYNVTAVPLSDTSANNIAEILCVMQNITERRRMEDGLINALEKEKELGELKSRFVTMASHEFRTPLTTILSSTYLLENFSEAQYAKEKGTHINRIKRAVKNLTMILNEFLSLQKLEENRVQLVFSDTNVPEYIQDLIGEMEAAKKDGQGIEYVHSGDQAMARLDHHLLWSIVTNLLSNSLKYSKPGHQVTITSEISDDFITIKVKDTGIGIPDDEHKYIFGRFYRARNAVNYEGTGLGLHIVQKYVNLVRGTIVFESELDKGTLFTVTIPKEEREDTVSNNPFS
jgi:signal transduction histidine kinase